MSGDVPRRVTRSEALLLAWCSLAIVNAAVIEATGILRSAPASVRFGVHAFDAGHILAAGLLFGGFAQIWERWAAARLKRGLHAAVFAIAALLGAVLVREDMEGLAMSLGVEWTALALGGMAGCSVPLAHALGRLLAKPRLRWAAVAAGAAIAAGNGLVLERLYPGVHLVVAGGAAMLIAGALEEMALPFRAAMPRRRVATGAVGAVISLFAAWTLVVRPPTGVADALHALPSTVFAPYIAEVQSALAGTDAIPDIDGEWFRGRRGLPDVPASGRSVLPKDAVVILLVVDCLRADLIADPKYASDLPALHRMRGESHYFANAWSPGPATGQAITAIFAGRHYSALYWSKRPGSGKVLPHEDTSPRFTERLQAGGVTTVNFAGLSVLVNELGMVRGFTEEYRPEEKHAPAAWLVDRTLERVGEAEGEPVFVYAHFMEAHAPYDKGGVQGSLFERYLREVQIIDREIGRLVDTLSAGPHAGRTAIFVTADHGEAFGEHNTKYHASTVYEELIRVPLLVHAPGVRARAAEEQVTLVDIGPTVLDLFGMATPASMLGQSLVPLLRGERATLSRPIVSESGHLQRAMIFPDGTKMIHDTKRDTVELYDLIADPGELTNLYERGTEKSDLRLARVRAFFNAHVFKKRGYKTPVRR